VLFHNIFKTSSVIELKMGMQLIKYIDRYLGIPCVFSVGILDKIISPIKILRKQPKTIKKILFIKFWGFGNLIMAMPAVRAIKEKFPEAKIDFLTLKQNKGILDNLDFIDNVMYFEIENLTKFPLDFLKLAHHFRKQNIDMVIDLEQFSRASAIFTYLTGAPVRVGYRTWKQSKHHIYTKTIRYNNHQHTVLTFYNIAEALGAKKKKPSLIRITYSKEDSDTVGKFLKKNNISKKDKIIGMHIGSGENADVRRWPRECFAKLADMLTEKFHAKVVFTGSPNEADDINKTISLMNYKAYSTAGVFSLKQLASFVEHCRMFVSNDTGPLHLAAAMKVKCVAFFGPNTPLLYGPYSNNNIIFYKKLKCSPCVTNFNAKTTDCKNPICITGITVDEVFDAMSKHLKN